MPFTFEQVFLSALIFYFLVHFFTCTAEISHLKRTMFKVPEPLEKKIPLAQHIKAHRYDIARTKLNLVEVTITTLVILALTKFHGIDYLSELLMDQVGDQFAFHWMLPALIAFIFLIVDLPFTWQKEFRLREAYGYTRESQSQWFSQLALTSIIGWFSILPILWVGLWFWRQSGAEWWIIGWILFSIYLIFPLHLAQRLRYFFKPSMASEVTNPELVERFKEMGNRAGIGIKEIRVTRAEHDDDLPPAFAFGHRKGVRIFIRHNVLKQLSDDNLMAIGAHALARNLSHMYFQAWLVCSLVGLFVFMFLAWLAPQSWFLDEIGFKAIGPGPYYGSLISFAMVALPVLLFPFKLPMDAFLRHLIFRSDLFALRYAGLSSISNALIELTPSPMRHSCITLEFFDLLFSHEPSIMARLSRVKHNYQVMKGYHTNEDHLSSHLELRQHVENVERALQAYNAQQRLIESEKEDLQEQLSARKKEAELIAKAEAERASVTQPFGAFKDQDIENSTQQDNTLHRTYGMGLLRGFFDLISQSLKIFVKPKSHREATLNVPSSIELEDGLKIDSNEQANNKTTSGSMSSSIPENVSSPQSSETPAITIKVTTTHSAQPQIETETTLVNKEVANVATEHNAEAVNKLIANNEKQNDSVQHEKVIAKTENTDSEFNDNKTDTRATSNALDIQGPSVPTVSSMEIADASVANLEKAESTPIDIKDEGLSELSKDDLTGGEDSIPNKNAEPIHTVPTDTALTEMSDVKNGVLVAQISSITNDSEGPVISDSDATHQLLPEMARLMQKQSTDESSTAETTTPEEKVGTASSEEKTEEKPKRKRTSRSKTSATSDESSSTEGAEKPKRTRTTKTTTVTRKRIKKAESTEVDQASQEVTNTDTPSIDIAEDQVATPKTTRSATKSTTRKTTRKKTQEVVPENTQADGESSSSNASSETVDSTVEVVTKPKRTRSTTKSTTRKTTQKKAEEVTPENTHADGEGSSNNASTETVDSTVEAVTKPKRTRSTTKSTTRKATQKKTEEVTPENTQADGEGSSSNASSETIDGSVEVATKPKRTRSTTKNTTRKTTRKKVEEVNQEDTQPDGDTISSNTPIETIDTTVEVTTKPKRKRSTTKSTTTRSTRKKALEVTPEVDNHSTSVSEDGVEVTEEAVTKPKRTRSTTKTTTRKTPVRKATRKNVEDTAVTNDQLEAINEGEELGDTAKDEVTQPQQILATTKKKTEMEPAIELTEDNNEQAQ